MGIMLVEPTIVQDIFVNGVLPEDMGDGTMRFTGYSKQRSLSFEGIDYVVVNRVIMPVPAIMASIKETMKALGVQCCGGERMRLLAH
ncbi:hypothetical protein [Mesorhizobium sp. M4B.F.Ca.ET.143.01.1.1]|uniref:hypothetical protein n=1 Tax=Mesorhizobium sp. M4B.F.Ca.ET.143.01.1.1 TaxID=2563947 RepID=UPI001093ED7A|nr:hypothetical protein [Mesorhizobium sp. M4B.F.Ca.ET.143.01.1.1]TGV26355.1 hypothetical protein EN786_12600 [Mesorhizobium sp. M4B.F.Ca.ET.143.01.1.1]